MDRERILKLYTERNRDKILSKCTDGSVHTLGRGANIAVTGAKKLVVATKRASEVFRPVSPTGLARVSNFSFDMVKGGKTIVEKNNLTIAK